MTCPRAFLAMRPRRVTKSPSYNRSKSATRALPSFSCGSLPLFSGGSTYPSAVLVASDDQVLGLGSRNDLVCPLGGLSEGLVNDGCKWMVGLARVRHEPNNKKHPRLLVSVSRLLSLSRLVSSRLVSLAPFGKFPPKDPDPPSKRTKRAKKNSPCFPASMAFSAK
jgi:hypothetical protein